MANNPPNTSRSRVGTWGTAEVRDDMIRRYVHDRQSLRQIAAELGCGYGTVHLILSTAGVALRPRGGSRRRTAVDPGLSTQEPPAVTAIVAATFEPDGRLAVTTAGAAHPPHQ